MFDFILCGLELTCHLRQMSPDYYRPKYPPEVREICIFYEQSKLKLPDECKWKTHPDDIPPPPRRRNEF